MSIPEGFSSRRSFLRASTAAAAVALIPRDLTAQVATRSTTSPTAAPRRHVLTPAEFRQRMEGPILTIPMPFNSSFEIDHPGIARMIDRSAKAGIELFAMTAGNGQYDSLTYEETKSANRTFVESVGGRGIAIAAGGPWWTGQAVDFARYARDIDADALQVMIPARASDVGEIAKHYRIVAEAAHPLPIVLHGLFSEALLTELVKIEAVSALKEDSTLEDYIARQMHFGARLSIFGGGGDHRFLVGRPYGSRAFYSSYAPFRPDITMRVWHALQTGDEAAATKLIETFDLPLIQNFSVQLWHGALEYFGVAERYLRPPQSSYSDAQMVSIVKPFFDAQQLTPE